MIKAEEVRHCKLIKAKEDRHCKLIKAKETRHCKLLRAKEVRRCNLIGAREVMHCKLIRATEVRHWRRWYVQRQDAARSYSPRSRSLRRWQVQNGPWTSLTCWLDLYGFVHCHMRFIVTALVLDK